MSEETGRQRWGFILSALLIIAIISGGIVFGFKQCGGDNSIEIIPPAAEASTIDVYLTGAIANEGIYTFNEDSSIGDIIHEAGGKTGNADHTSIEIHIPVNNEDSSSQFQKININTAEGWLLEALPRIGPTLAQRIIEYRENEGLFQSVDDLIKVNGIGTVTLENIIEKISVVD